MSEPPFAPPAIPEFAGHSDKMVYLYVTDYVANSGWYAAIDGGERQLTVHENTV